MSRHLVRQLISQETVAYQKDPKCFQALTAILDTLIEKTGLTDPALKAAGTEMEKVIFAHTGLLVRIKWRGFKNAYAQIPIALNLSSPLAEQFKVFGPAGKKEFNDFIASLKKVDSTLTGLVDLKTSRVGGLFSKMRNEVCLGTDLISKNGFIRLTGAEMAAILLHELGHLFCFYELLATTMMTNYAMETVLEGLKRQPDRMLRIKLIEAGAEALQAKGTKADKLADEKNPEIVQAVLLNNAVQYSRSANGSRVYDYRSFEFLADQFSSLHGAGRSLAAALDKLHAWGDASFRLQSDWSFFHNAVIAIRSVFSNVVMAVATVLPTTLAALLLIMAIPGLDEELYDPPQERLARIKRNLIQAIKDDRLSQLQRDDLAQDIATVDELIDKQPSQYFNRVFLYVYRHLTSHRREQTRQMDFQQDLEKLAANDLFVAAHHISTLSSKS